MKESPAAATPSWARLAHSPPKERTMTNLRSHRLKRSLPKRKVRTLPGASGLQNSAEVGVVVVVWRAL
jgi:hypothetical protein